MPTIEVEVRGILSVTFGEGDRNVLFKLLSIEGAPAPESAPPEPLLDDVETDDEASPAAHQGKYKSRKAAVLRVCEENRSDWLTTSVIQERANSLLAPRHRWSGRSGRQSLLNYLHSMEKQGILHCENDPHHEGAGWPAATWRMV